MLADTSIKVVLEMFFLSLSNANFKFGAKKLFGRSYITAKALSTAKKIKLIHKHEFVEVVFDDNSNIFVIHVAILGGPELSMLIHCLRASVIS